MRGNLFAVAVDLVVLTVRDAELRALLVRRDAPPFAGRWGLPGGFVLPHEDLLDTATRHGRFVCATWMTERIESCRREVSFGGPGTAASPTSAAAGAGGAGCVVWSTSVSSAGFPRPPSSSPPSPSSVTLNFISGTDGPVLVGSEGDSSAGW